MKQINVIIMGYNNFQKMNVCFNDLNCKIGDIEYTISYLPLAMEINLKTENLDINLETEFWNIYDYLGFILGYFPDIDKIEICGEKNNEINLANIVEKYKTSNDYIHGEEQFICGIDNECFITSFCKFKNLKEEVSFQISIYNISMMKNNMYPEIRITNILQTLDGIYDKLSITEGKRNIITDVEKIYKFKEYINTIPLEPFVDKEDELKIIRKQIKDVISRLEFVNYDTKLRNIFNYLNDKYEIFDLEKKQTNENKDFNKFISKCKHTRNKLSHATEIKNSFNGTESALYIYKLLLCFRLLILLEIGLEHNIEKSILKTYLNLINNRIKEELNLD